MKILFTADWHLGLPQISWTDGNWERILEQQASVEEMILQAVKNNCEYFIIGGDIFHTSKPSSKIIEIFAELIEKIINAGLKIFIIHGNHDISMHENILKAIAKFNKDNVLILSQPASWAFAKINLIFIPFELGTDYTIEVKRHLVKQKLNILVMHDTFSGGMTGSEDFVLKGKTNLIKKVPQVDLVLCGHLHKQQVLSGKTEVIYPGSITTIDFGEENDKKGFATIDITSKGITYQMHNLAVKKWKTITVDLRMKAQKIDIPKNTLIKFKFIMTKSQRLGFNLQPFETMIKNSHSKLQKYTTEVTNKQTTQKKLKQKNPVSQFKEYMKHKKYSVSQIDKCVVQLNNIIKEI